MHNRDRVSWSLYISGNLVYHFFLLPLLACLVLRLVSRMLSIEAVIDVFLRHVLQFSLPFYPFSLSRLV